MSRRSRRQRARASERQPSPAASQSPAHDEVDFREEYQYVLADLKRIGMLAAVMTAVLVGLSLLLP